MTEVYASHKPGFLTGLDGVLLTGSDGVRLISGWVLSTAWERELVGVLPGTITDQPAPAQGEWKRDANVVATPVSPVMDYKG